MRVSEKTDCSVSKLKFIFDQYLKNALDDYKTKMDAELNTSIPLDWENFESKAKSVAKISKDNFKLALGCEHTLKISFLELFDKKVDELHEKNKSEHKRKIKSYYKNKLKLAWENLECERKPQIMDKKNRRKI